MAEDGSGVLGFINSGAADDPDLSNEELKDLAGHDPNGVKIVILSIAVDPHCRGRGVSRALMDDFIANAKHMNKQAILLLCKEYMIGYYKKFHFKDLGLSASEHGGSRWHEMQLLL